MSFDDVDAINNLQHSCIKTDFYVITKTDLFKDIYHAFIIIGHQNMDLNYIE